MNDPLRIAIITTDARYWLEGSDQESPNFGTAVRGLLQGFEELHHVEIHVISASPSQLTSPRMLGAHIHFHHVYVPRLGWGKTLFQGCVRATRKLLDEIHPDIVHGQGTERDCAMSAVLSGYPNVVTIHGNMRVHAKLGENRNSLYYKLAAQLEGFCLKRTDGVVAISRYTEDLVKDLAPRTWFLPNAVDRRFFDIELEPPQVPRILFVGSIDERKNPLGLIRACEPMLRAGECTIAMAGLGNPDHPYVSEVLKQAGEIPGIKMLGFIDRDELGEEFRRSSLLVLPTFEDNCPMVVLEAMAAGLPVAASRVGGVPDLISHEIDGLMFDPHSSDDVRTCIEKLVREPETRTRLGNKARLTALERFHPKVIAQAHLEIYHNLLGR